MRTTISMDRHLLDKLKERAAESGSTVSRLIETAVRVMLSAPPQNSDPAETFELVTYGAGGRFSRFNVDKTSGLIAAEDIERYGENEGS